MTNKNENEIRHIYTHCPKCKSYCYITVLEYEPSLGRFKCNDCGLMGTVETGIKDKDENENEKSCAYYLKE